MSSIFSDPFFRRGSTLLGGEAIETDSNGPIAGREVVGQVKAFQDVTPTGLGERHSNRLVFCVAARYTGTANLTSADAGSLFVFDSTASTGDLLASFKDKATATNAKAGTAVGVLDEYIGGNVVVRPNDIVWLVVKGPATVNQTASSIAKGKGISPSATAGAVAAASTTAGDLVCGQKLAETSAAAAGVRVNMHSDAI
jgi:hypothetical protein